MVLGRDADGETVYEDDVVEIIGAMMNGVRGPAGRYGGQGCFLTVDLGNRESKICRFSEVRLVERAPRLLTQ